MIGYLAFVRAHARFLSFGFLLSFFSSFGQTFFIALFSGELRQTFSLSHGEFGMVYSLATLASGLTMIWLGGKLDRSDLRRYSLFAVLGLATAAVGMALADNILLLVAALFGLRLCGQGLMSHAAVTSMARYFRAGRGKAVSIAAMGHPGGEAVFPTLLVALLAVLAWREVWLAAAVVLVAGLVPVIAWLLHDHSGRQAALLLDEARQRPDGRPVRGYTRRQVLRDPRFYLVLPRALAPSFLITGFFFHQVHIVEAKGWDLAWFALSFSGYAVGGIVGMLFGGPMVDRLSAIRLMPYYLAPLAVACLVLGLIAHPAAAMIFMLLGGLTSGAAASVVTSMWAEVYGIRHLGAIKAMAASLMVLATALSPAGMGWLIDRGAGVVELSLGGAAMLVGAMILILVAFRRQEVTSGSL